MLTASSLARAGVIGFVKIGFGFVHLNENARCVRATQNDHLNLTVVTTHLCQTSENINCLSSIIGSIFYSNSKSSYNGTQLHPLTQESDNLLRLNS